MSAGRLLLAVVLSAAACAPDSAPVPAAARHGSVAERLADLSGRKPLDYAMPDSWGCSPLTNDDVCDAPRLIAVQVTDGTTLEGTHPNAAEPVADCFYVYPTVDLSLRADNHDSLADVFLPRGVIAFQSAPFGAACRVYAPFYRQATIGTYAERPDRAIPIFLNALADVAAAFEYYLEHWNQGRPLVILGHSQGAQMASYLLHSYFDGVSEVTQIAGSETSTDLRARLVGAFPIGFSVFTPQGQLVGGSFSDLPLCASPEETGCVTTYRSYTDGSNVFARSFGADLDARMADLGFLHRAIGRGDSLACVNPATGLPVSPGAATDGTGKGVAAGDLRILEGTWVVTNPLEGLLVTPGRYVAACRDDIYGGGYLAISLHDPAPAVDMRGDPLGVRAAKGSVMGLHTSDFHLPMGDLIELVRRKSAAFQSAR